MKTLFLLASCVLAAVPSLASADPISTGQWYTFGFGDGAGAAIGNGSGFTLGTDPNSVAAPDTPWTFTLGELGGTLTVSDGFLSGDQFELFDGGSSLGATSTPVVGADCGNDISACLASSAHSHGVFTLGAGAHSITGDALLSPFAGGGAAFFTVTPNTSGVPEPATWAMLVTGFGLAGGALRRRTSAALA